jgi:hypothetical protein
VTDDDTRPTEPEQDAAYRYATLMNEARAGRLNANGFRELERIRTAVPELAEAYR